MILYTCRLIGSDNAAKCSVDSTRQEKRVKKEIPSSFWHSKHIVQGYMPMGQEGQCKKCTDGIS